MKFSDVWNASKFVIGIGSIIVFFQFLAYIGLDFVNSIPLMFVAGAFSSFVIWTLSLVIFFPLFMYLAYNCAKKFSMSPIETAITVAFSAAVIGAISILFDIIRYALFALGILGITSVLNSEGPTTEALALSGLGFAGRLGICSVGFVLGSIVVNFMIGFIGGMIFENKSRIPTPQQSAK